MDRWRHRLRLRAWEPHLAWGRRAEDVAHRYLQKKGFTVVERNWAWPGHAEVDLVAWQGETLVFIEVKSRHDAAYAEPEARMNEEKRQRLRLGARLLAKRWKVGLERVRFDLVTVVFEPYRLEHTVDAWPLEVQRGSRR